MRCIVSAVVHELIDAQALPTTQKNNGNTTGELVSTSRAPVGPLASAQLALPLVHEPGKAAVLACQ